MVIMVSVSIYTVDGTRIGGVSYETGWDKMGMMFLKRAEILNLSSRGRAKVRGM